MDIKKEKGNKGEQLAVGYLIKNGFTILFKNWRFLKGEIDIICEKNELIIFVEVKTRSSIDFGNPEEFVSRKQQKLIVNTAHEYLISHQVEKEARFDIISIVLKENNTFEIEHLEDAFGPTL